MTIGSGTQVRTTALVAGTLTALGAAIWQLPTLDVASRATIFAAAVPSAAAIGARTDALSAPAQSALDQVLGPGHSLVTASATYGPASSRRSTTYDAKHVAALRQSRASASGYRATVVDNGVSSTVTDSTTAATIRRITVAVLVDSRLRPAPKQSTIRQIVTAAMGLQVGRGDRISIAPVAIVPAGSAAFVPAAPTRSASTRLSRIRAYLPSAVGVGVAMGLMCTLAWDALGRRRRTRPRRR